MHALRSSLIFRLRKFLKCADPAYVVIPVAYHQMKQIMMPSHIHSTAVHNPTHATASPAVTSDPQEICRAVELLS
jgi:hypothetical protein